MAWKIKFHKNADDSFAELETTTKKRIKKFLDKLVQVDNPRSQGKVLIADHHGLWRYRVGNYRLICDIQDKEIIILVLNIGHRSKIYKRN